MRGAEGAGAVVAVASHDNHSASPAADLKSPDADRGATAVADQLAVLSPFHSPNISTSSAVFSISLSLIVVLRWDTEAMVMVSRLDTVVSPTMDSHIPVIANILGVTPISIKRVTQQTSYRQVIASSNNQLVTRFTKTNSQLVTLTQMYIAETLWVSRMWHKLGTAKRFKVIKLDISPGNLLVMAIINKEDMVKDIPELLLLTWHVRQGSSPSVRLKTLATTETLRFNQLTVRDMVVAGITTTMITSL